MVEVEIGAVVEVHVVALAALVVVEVGLAFPERLKETLLKEYYRSRSRLCAGRCQRRRKDPNCMFTSVSSLCRWLELIPVNDRNPIDFLAFSSLAARKTCS